MIIRQLVHTVKALIFNSRPSLLTNSFFANSQLKPRIQMLVNPQTNRRALWRYVLVVPVAVFLLMCSQKDGVENKVLPINNGIANQSIRQKAPAVTDKVFTVVEQNPVPQAGMEGLGNYLRANLRYPEAARKANVAGKVFVSFVVTTDGDITDVQVLKGLGFGCDAEAVRVVLQMPNWIPGRQNGKPVNVRFNLPIMFSLE